jgi:type IV pilus assembly protein PilB
MKIKDEQLSEILIEQGYISKKEIEGFKEQREKQERSLEEILLKSEVINKDLIGQAIAEHFKVSYYDLNTNVPEKDVMLSLSRELAYKHHMILIEQEGINVKVVTSKPDRKGLKEKLKEYFGKDSDIEIMYSLHEDIEELLWEYQEPLADRVKKLIDGSAPAMDIIEEVVYDAYERGVSDIHIEPEEDQVIVRFRIDGVLQKVSVIPKDKYEYILNRIKIWAQLRIDEHFKPQDGPIRHKYKDYRYDLRVSIIPTLGGEKAAIRVLSKYTKNLGLEDLGISKEHREIITEAAQSPYGMILVVGPTGSGKTTTLYAVLEKLRSVDVNITTIEDPAEYRIKGVNQIQVNRDAGLDFVSGLRSIVRQDPDIVLVGEIRDIETAEISINAALTGHLVLSTFHANDAPTAVPRLLDMEMEPFLLASTLNVVIAQRLVRTVCDNCMVSYDVGKDFWTENYPRIPGDQVESINTLYKGKGCSKCNNTGYSGRTAVYEIVQVTKKMKDLMVQKPSATQIIDLAKKQGFKSMFADGLDKVKKGITTIDEVLRVAEIDDKIE